MLICTLLGLVWLAVKIWSAFDNHMEAEDSRIRQSWEAANRTSLGNFSDLYSDAHSAGLGAQEATLSVARAAAA